ncbi:hypothetical protein EBZ80_01910 [bacterium]|nr:hypothetical protein [bacterium]
MSSLHLSQQVDNFIEEIKEWKDEIRWYEEEITDLRRQVQEQRKKIVGLETTIRRLTPPGQEAAVAKKWWSWS